MSSRLARVAAARRPGSPARHAKRGRPQTDRVERLRIYPSVVAIAGDEDSFNHVWVPRLHVAGANLRRVKYIDSGTNGTLDVREDAEPLREFVNDLGIHVLYFDQLLDNLGYTDTWKDKQVRDALAPLRRIAQEGNLAVLAALQPNKRGGSFRNQISGTPAFNAMSRFEPARCAAPA